eukprot:471637-Pelagomonas_calceolata.AAC.1
MAEAIANSARHMVLDLTTTISVSPCAPVRDFEHKSWARLVRGEALALFKTGHVGVHSIEDPRCAEKEVNLIDAGLWIVVAK